MDLQTLFNSGLSLACGVIGWLARELWFMIKDLRQDLSKLREEMAKEYVTKVDFRDALNDLRQILQRIYDKLDDKADK